MPGLYQTKGNGKIDLSHFKPILRAYALGYVSVTGPRLFALLRVLRQKDVAIEVKVQSLLNVLRISTYRNRFPVSCAIIIGGATLLPRIFTSFVFNPKRRFRLNGNISLYTRLVRSICTFLSALLAFTLLNRDDSWSHKRARSLGLLPTPTALDLPNQHHLPTSPPPQLAGKTIDLTLFTSTRALSVATLALWNRTQSSRHHPTHTHPKLAKLLAKLADPAIFSLSAALILHAFFYTPDRLPRSYNHWIHKAAEIDPRFLSVVRLAKTGDWKYGVDNGEPNKLLRGVARDLHLPEEWGDPALTIPIKCELVHSGCGPSCELHALWRFYRAWLLGMEMYLPLQLTLRLLRRPTLHSLLHSLANAARSSAFLGAFISLFYYGVCLSRTRLGPLLFPPPLDQPTSRWSWRWRVSPQTWDSGLCILAGCVLCGCSILVESAGRRGEVAFFVAPRALATLLPRVYERKKRWREGVVFAGGVAVVLDAVTGGRGREERVRGVLGRVLSGVVREG